MQQHGAGGKGPGSPRRLAILRKQFDVTGELDDLGYAGIMEKLLPEFDRFSSEHSKASRLSPSSPPYRSGLQELHSGKFFWIVSIGSARTLLERRGKRLERPNRRAGETQRVGWPVRVQH